MLIWQLLRVMFPPWDFSAYPMAAYWQQRIKQRSGEVPTDAAHALIFFCVLYIVLLLPFVAGSVLRGLGVFAITVLFIVLIIARWDLYRGAVEQATQWNRYYRNAQPHAELLRLTSIASLRGLQSHIMVFAWRSWPAVRILWLSQASIAILLTLLLLEGNDWWVFTLTLFIAIEPLIEFLALACVTLGSSTRALPQSLVPPYTIWNLVWTRLLALLVYVLLYGFLIGEFSLGTFVIIAICAPLAALIWDWIPLLLVIANFRVEWPLLWIIGLLSQIIIPAILLEALARVLLRRITRPLY